MFKVHWQIVTLFFIYLTKNASEYKVLKYFFIPCQFTFFMNLFFIHCGCVDAIFNDVYWCNLIKFFFKTHVMLRKRGPVKTNGNKNRPLCLFCVKKQGVPNKSTRYTVKRVHYYYYFKQIGSRSTLTQFDITQNKFQCC